MRSALRLLLGLLTAACALVLGAIPAIASGDNTPGTPGGQVSDVKTRTGLVQLIFSAGDLPPGSVLDPSSVVVTVDGTPLDAKASTASAAVDAKTPAREVILALDVSGSMKGDGIVAARAAAKQYVNGLPADVRVGIVTFSTRAHVLQTPTADRALLVTALGKVTAGGDTSLYDAVVSAADLTRSLPANAQRRLLILSDGDDTSSTHSLASAEAALSALHIPADVVAFRLPGQPKVLQGIASHSGGRVLPATSAGDLAGAFATAAKEFRQQLLVSVKIPANLADATKNVQVSANAGTTSVTGSAVIHLPGVAAAAAAKPLQVSKPAGSTSKVGLAIVLGLSFLALLTLAMIALFLPLMRSARAEKASRLADVGRYRVVGALGSHRVAAAPVDQPTRNLALTERTLSLVDRTVRARGKREALVGELDRAGLRMRPEEWATLQVIVPVIVGSALWLLAGSFLLFPLGGAVGFAGMRVFIRHKITKRAEEFAHQLPDTLQLLVGSLRTGFSLNQAFAGVVREGSEPTASEFARALTEVRLGAELEDAIDGVAERMQCEDLHWVVMAVRISREVGGNLGEVLSTTMSTMRQRVELRGLVKILSAEGRLSARVLVGLPFVVAGAVSILRPGYMSPLFHTLPGIVLLVSGICLLTLGSFWLSRIVKIEV